MKKIILLVFASVVLLSAMFSLTKESTSLSEAIIYVDPSTNDVSVGNIFVVNVSVADVADLSSFGFCLGYNTTILDVLSVWVPPPFEPPIIIPPPDGYIHVAAKSPIPFSGSGTLASITFNVTVVGSSILDLYDATLFDSTGDPIPYTIVDGSVMVSSVIIKVPGDYPTIQEAINAASDGDTIFVCNGTYYENVFVSKAITLIGESKEGTIIDGGGVRTTVEVHVNNVTITGFTIENSNIPLSSGIEIYNSNYVNIIDNIITNNNGYGVEIYGSSYLNTVSDNIITNNQVVGILIYDPNGKAGWNVVKANRIINNSGSGIVLTESHTNTLEANVVTSQGTGIFLNLAANNTIKNNLIANNQKGIYLWGYPTLGNSFFHNNFINNTYQAYGEYISSNSWDDGYPSGGNYWSDYNGTDANHDGIGDTPYIINGTNQDRYPLMSPWTSLPVHNINTGLGYITIQEAINASETLDGHIIFVEEGTYYENLVINKSISLIGENKVTTTIAGSMTATVVAITADNVTISQFTIRNGGDSYAGITLSSNGNNITNNIMRNNWCGISLEHYSAYNVIADNIVMGNLNGIIGELWSDTTIINNILKDNLLGINTNYCDRNTIAFNNITNHWSQGIMIQFSSHNTIVGNNITDNNLGGFQEGGIYIGYSSHNKFFHNNIIANGVKQVEVRKSSGYPSVNTWDEGYPSGGNYWSDYTGVDANGDGIGDTPYTIDANNTDRYPLVAPFTMFDAGTWNGVSYSVDVVSNSMISDFTFNASEKLVSFNVTGSGGTTGFSRVAIPKQLLWAQTPSQWIVVVGGVAVTPTVTEDANYIYLYFTYTHSTKTIQITGTNVVPEFPSAIILPLLMALTMFAIIFSKRRIHRKSRPNPKPSSLFYDNAFVHG